LLVADPHFGGNQGAARKMSDETGGRMIVGEFGEASGRGVRQISEELRSQYTLGYYPTNSAHDGKFRKIKVDMSNHDYKVLAARAITPERLSAEREEWTDMSVHSSSASDTPRGASYAGARFIFWRRPQWRLMRPAGAICSLHKVYARSASA